VVSSIVPARLAVSQQLCIDFFENAPLKMHVMTDWMMDDDVG